MNEKTLRFPAELVRDFFLEDLGISQREFADSLDIPPPQFSGYMNGVQPSEKTLRKIYMMYPELEKKIKEGEQGLTVRKQKAVHYIESDALDYMMQYGTEKQLVLKSNQPDTQAVRITYTNIERFNP